ncbi:DUF6519 domain-containing protein [Gloeocapsopsis dulcis]|nr:DUF6519 domain-containing protein [Gloeocapsopsis dulcis]
MQQGRVQLDSDWNEQVDILLHYLQTLAADLIGPYGGPAIDLGFTIEEIKINDAPVKNDFIIRAGRYYVDGILCELEKIPIPIEVVKKGNESESKKIKVANWIFQNLEFQVNQYVEIFDEEDTKQKKIAQILNLERENQLLELNTDVGQFETKASAKVRHITTYNTQPDYPLADNNKLEPDNKYLVYLDVWERHITYIEDANEYTPGIREAALHGIDTATRSKVVWQVKATELLADELPQLQSQNAETRSRAFLEVKEKWQASNRGKLMAISKRDVDKSSNPCITTPGSRYRGVENQLYRVEIHGGRTIKNEGNRSVVGIEATFKWSRENSSVAFSIKSVEDNNNAEPKIIITLASIGKDSHFSLSEGDWVEIVDDDYILQNRAEPLFKITYIDRTSNKVTLAGKRVSKVGSSQEKHPLLRCWHKLADSSEKDKEGALLIREGEWLTLENGVQIQFQKPISQNQLNQYRTGDYWLIPARTATGDVEWPGSADHPEALPPHGIEHHYAPLAIISLNADGNVTVEDGNLQRQFKPLSMGGAPTA